MNTGRQGAREAGFCGHGSKRPIRGEQARVESQRPLAVRWTASSSSTIRISRFISGHGQLRGQLRGRLRDLRFMPGCGTNRGSRLRMAAAEVPMAIPPAAAHKIPARLRQALYGVLVAASLLTGGGTARAVRILAGPMVGAVTSTSARVWIALDTSDVVRVRCFDINTNREVCSIGTAVHGPPPFIVNAPLGGLQPDRDYRITLTANGAPVPLPPPALIIHTYPAPRILDNFTLAFGSGSDTVRYPDVSIWRQIARLQPRAFIFAGDTMFLPKKLSAFPYTYYAALRFIEQHYAQARRYRGWQRLLRICPLYATWDNRDFGTLHAGASFVFRDESLLAFEKYWPNPGYGYRATLGTFCRFRLGDVEVFLLDDRTFRRPPAPGHPGTMLGAAQLAWLKRRLLQSRADFNLIVDGDPMLAKYHHHECWANFGAEREKFLQWLFTHDVSGVVFLSGHNGFGELTRRPADPRALDQYPLYDLTSSSLAAAPLAPDHLARWRNAWRIGAPVRAHNFGVIAVGGPAGNRHLTMRLVDAHGQTRLSKTLSVSMLSAN